MSTMTSSLEMEATLLSTGWWSRYSNDTSKRCKWSGDLSSLEHLDLSTNYLTALLSSWFLLWLRAKYNIPEPNVTKNGDLFSIWNFDGRIAFQDIIKATNDFEFRYCIGTGGYDSVYRAQLPSAMIVTLKETSS
ncbi:hypothetical protein V6N11_054358 [Hibiscus sabdariffa]|uniref:non-specific serine/threonine protein kinase n=1 Tax=Hibiscus sabdariffa TaxID=183260 RepID=A0ABR2S440_9ROSI